MGADEEGAEAPEWGLGLMRGSSGPAGTLDVSEDLPFNGGENQGRRWKCSFICSFISSFIQRTEHLLFQVLGRPPPTHPSPRPVGETQSHTEEKCEVMVGAQRKRKSKVGSGATGRTCSACSGHPREARVSGRELGDRNGGSTLSGEFAPSQLGTLQGRLHASPCESLSQHWEGQYHDCPHSLNNTEPLRDLLI